MPPIDGKSLILYIYTVDTKLGVLWAQEDQNNKELSIILVEHWYLMKLTTHSLRNLI